MAAPAESTALTVNRRPEFVVDGAYQPRLEVDCLRLEVGHDEFGMSFLEAVFTNWGRATASSAPGFLHFGRDALDLGKEIVVRVPAEDAVHEIFRGEVTALEADFPELRAPELIVRAEDESQRLRMRQRSRFFEDKSDADIAGEVASDRGLQQDVDVAGPSHAELWQVNQSDLAFLRERARAVDARIDLQGGRLAFLPRRATGDPPVALTRENDLLSFCVSADLAHQRREVRVHGFSVPDKRAIHETADDAAMTSEVEGIGRTGPAILTALGREDYEEQHLEFPASDDEARHLAEALLRERARRFLCGRGVTKGTPSLRVGGRVEIVDLGPRFSGIYYVAELRHRYDRSAGYRTHFLAERAELGDPA